MRNPNFYAAFAVILPVSLGLGLVYLTIIGRIEPAMAVMFTLGLAALVFVLVYVRDITGDPQDEERRGPPRF